MEMNSISSKSASKSTIDKDRSLQAFLSAFSSRWISFSIFIKKIPSHKVDISSSFIVKSIFMSTCSLSRCKLGCNIVLNGHFVVSWARLFSILVQFDCVIWWWNWWFFVILTLNWKHSKDTHVHHSCSHQMHVRKSSQTMVSITVPSKVLKFHVLFFKEGCSIWSKPDIAIRNLSVRRIRPASKPNSTSSNLEVGVCQDKLKE